MLSFNLFPRLLATLLAALLCASTLTGANELPQLGDPSLRDFNAATEKRYGELFYQTLRANTEFVEDELLEHYLVSLGQKLLTHSGASTTDFKFFIVRSEAINAFAGPDAYIGINSGLMLRAKNESELASVLAHEIAHVSQRHLARMFSRQGESTAITLGAIIAAILVGSQSPDAAQAILATGIAGSYQDSINFTRENEYEADRVGIGILSDAGIDPRGMVGFFRTLLEESQGLQIEYLRTHPLNVNRVSEAEHRIGDLAADGRSDSEDFRYAKARLQALTVEDPAKLLLDDGELSTPHLVYRQALLQIRLGRPAAAIAMLRPLAGDKSHPWVRLALAQALEHEGDIGAAMELTDNLVKLYPGYLPATIAYSMLHLEHDKHLNRTITLLKHQLHTDNKASLHRLLAQAYFANGQTAAALESTGNQYLLQGYSELALQQYQNALKQDALSDTARQRLQTRVELLQGKTEDRRN